MISVEEALAHFAAHPQEVLGLFGGAVVDATAGCRFVNGHSASQLVPPSTCAAALCTTGQVVGGLQGDLDVTVSVLEPAPPDPSVPTVQRFIGQSVITTRDGSTLVGTDVGAVDVADGQIGTLLTWTSGTGEFTGASGHIVINGRADFVAGTVVTDYRGEVCTP